MRMSCLLVGVTAILTLAGASPAAAAVEVPFWHPFPGNATIGATLNRLVDEFNASQGDYKVVSVVKGSYNETMNAAVAAYRAKQPPALVVVIARDGATMMKSGAIVPVRELMKSAEVDIDWSRYVRGVLATFADKEGPVAMPFNSSTPVLWYNVDALEKAGMKPPRTWDELGEVARAVRKVGYECGVTSSWQVWVNRDSYSFTNDLPIASRENGMEGFDAEFVYNTTRFVGHVERLKSWMDEGIYTYTGREWQGAVESFVQGKCAMVTESSAGYGGFKQNAKFRFAATYLPVEADTADPKNSQIGGGAIWVLKGHKPDVYRGAAEFFRFIGSPEKQLDWHKATGYVPVTLAAYELGKAQGYYAEFPHQEIAIRQLSRGTPSPNTRGTRLGYEQQNVTILEEELENVWSGKKAPRQAIDDAVRRSNENLRRFERLAERF